MNEMPQENALLVNKTLGVQHLVLKESLKSLQALKTEITDNSMSGEISKLAYLILST